jgi:hypothetical protein
MTITIQQYNSILQAGLAGMALEAERELAVAEAAGTTTNLAKGELAGIRMATDLVSMLGQMVEAQMVEAEAAAPAVVDSDVFIQDLIVAYNEGSKNNDDVQDH